MTDPRALVQSLRALARCEHSDLSIGAEAADALEAQAKEIEAAWEASGATERSQGLGWQIQAIVSLSRERMDAIYEMRSEISRQQQLIERYEEALRQIERKNSRRGIYEPSIGAIVQEALSGAP